LFSQSICSAALTVYEGNGNDDRGGAIGKGSLFLEDKGTWVSGTIQRPAGAGYAAQFDDILVLYLDVEPGGFADTTALTASGSYLQSAISGNCSWSISTAEFAPGFLADYAIALGSTKGGGVLYHFASDGSFDSETAIPLSPMGDALAAAYTFSFDWSSLGVTAESPHGFRFQSSYVAQSGVHYLESYESTSGAAGNGKTVTFLNYNTFGVVPTPVPEMTNAGLAVFGVLLAGSELVSRTRRWMRRRKEQE